MSTRAKPLAEVLDNAGATVLALVVAAMLLAFMAHGHHYYRPDPLPQPIAEPLDLGLD